MKGEIRFAPRSATQAYSHLTHTSQVTQRVVRLSCLLCALVCMCAFPSPHASPTHGQCPRVRSSAHPGDPSGVPDCQRWPRSRPALALSSPWASPQQSSVSGVSAWLVVGRSRRGHSLQSPPPTHTRRSPVPVSRERAHTLHYFLTVRAAQRPCCPLRARPGSRPGRRHSPASPFGSRPARPVSRGTCPSGFRRRRCPSRACGLTRACPGSSP